jgi:hypothetical protein
MRSYALVVLDKEDRIIDRYNLDIVTNPTENGFKLNLSLISTDIEDIITKVTQQKNIIKFTVYHYNNSYTKSNILASWIQKYSTANYKMALEYNDTKVIRYCEGKVISLTKTELDDYKNLAQDLQFQQTTPFFIKQENTITIQVSSVGKSYPYKYPYSYGSSVVENNEINNPYILDIPLIVTINGAISNPTIDLLDENSNRYSRVKFDGVTIAEGETLIVNSAQRKIIKILQDGTEEDYVPEVSPDEDTFLRAKSGLTKISVNTNDTAEGFKLTGGWRQYTL